MENQKKSFNVYIAALFGKVKQIPKKIIIPATIAVVALIGGIVLLSLYGNTYKSPVRKVEKILNTRNVKTYTNSMFYDGITDAETNEGFLILRESEYYQDVMDLIEKNFEERIENYIDNYGENFSFKYMINYKEKLEREELRDFQKRIDEIGDEIEEVVEESEDLDSDEFEEAAEDELGISKKEMKELLKILKKAGKKYKSAEVSKGYKLYVTLVATGNELDEPKEFEEETIYVYKVNGKWTSGDYVRGSGIMQFINLINYVE